MYPLHLGLKSIFLASAVSAIAVTAAHAVEAEDAATRLKNLLAVQQLELSYSAASLDGDDVVLAGVTVKLAQAPTAVELGDLTLEKVTEEDNGDYRVGRLFIDTISQTADEITFKIDDYDVQGLILPRDIATDPFGGVILYDSLNVSSIEVDIRDQDLLWVEDIVGTNTFIPDGTIEGNAEIRSFTLNLFQLNNEENDREFVDTLRDIGYDEIYGRVQIDSVWRPAEGRLTLSKFEILLDDIGTFNLTTDIGGSTAAFVRSLAELRKSGENPNAVNMAVLGLVQQLTFHGFGLRFDDGNFTGRMLNHIADKQGVEPKQLAQHLRTMLQTQLSPVAGEAFANSVSEAVGNFLDDPQNIEVAAKPAEPLPFFMLGAALVGAPEALIKQLGLTVTANQ